MVSGIMESSVTLTNLCLICRVGLQYRFAIIFDDGESDLKIEENFLLRLRVWRSVQGGGEFKYLSRECAILSIYHL